MPLRAFSGVPSPVQDAAMLRLALVVIVAVIGGLFAYRIPDLDVTLLGERGRGFFLFYSAALPVLLLFINSWLEESGLLSRLFATGAAVGVGLGLAIRLASEVFSPEPYLTFPFFGVLLEDTIADERAWLVANAVVSGLVAVAAFSSAGEDTPGDDA